MKVIAAEVAITKVHCSPSIARSSGTGLDSFMSLLIAVMEKVGVAQVLVAKGWDRHCTPWFGHDIGCLGYEMDTDGAKGVVMILAD